ncbi:xanthine dehydrogenase accessory factor [Peptoclostridium litorale DSM 5388]|uniref:Xanthine and CO dehydrogenases maturation factor,XdhC/CoxF family n=1 Tax=Peptoclostridium litorale DSM 5388 TaxID=1121324 RepID=A0A069RFZ6_PEPLI|nr:selenium-dependent molybdenum cofactor biosynthesis protein YqeB [Peptoclostridium litorale]KDR95733.1 xanthine and CO dehydrogenases maturation factor,XdhC/CoxF family [Peptoclostridium litorale DSM 5388]SIO22395.1 xanthine dehydrogenase accessory factor [Peptoclostridium litorale DSM 5388]
MFKKTVAVRGAGDIASGVIHRLHRCGFRVIVFEIEKPTVVRRRVSFAQAVFEGETEIESVRAVLAKSKEDVEKIWDIDEVAVVVDEHMSMLNELNVDVLVDATLAKHNMGITIGMVPITIGVGPGFFAGVDVDAVVETLRGHELGRVIYKGSARKNTGIPSDVCGYTYQRVLRAPCGGTVENILEIGDFVEAGDAVSVIEGGEIKAQISGVIRGLIMDGTDVEKGLKIGDIDPRGIYDYCFTISEKARAIGGGVLEAMLHLMSMNKL